MPSWLKVWKEQSKHRSTLIFTRFLNARKPSKGNNLLFCPKALTANFSMKVTKNK